MKRTFRNRLISMKCLSRSKVQLRDHLPTLAKREIMASQRVARSRTPRRRWDALVREDAMPLLDRYGMDEEARSGCKAFLEITNVDADNLRLLRQAFRDFSWEFAERFYRHLLSNPRTASLLKDPEQLEALKKIQANYFAEL